MSEDNMGYEEYWIAYFDVLGFGSDIETFHKYSVLNKYSEILREVDLQKWAVNCKWFSDSFIFYKKEDSVKAFAGVSSALEMFFRTMFKRHIPFRGCLHFGGFYEDEIKGIFFGPALIDAYKLAEKQKWIGFVLSKKAEEEARKIRDNGVNVWDILRIKYHEYDVPCKRKERCRLLAFNFRYSAIDSGQQLEKQYTDIWEELRSMEKKAHQILKNKFGSLPSLQKCKEYRNIIVKYKNTKKFLLEVFPNLRNKVKGKNRTISLR